MLAATTHIGSENSEITMEPYVFKKRVWENFLFSDVAVTECGISKLTVFKSYELPIRILNCEQKMVLVFLMICEQVFLFVVYSKSTNLVRNFFSIKNHILSVSLQ
jgi:hypothetical protein